MSPYYPHENWGDIQNYIFIKGTITAVQSDEDTADVTVPGGSDGSGVPIFYHCDPDSEERGNGAIEGGAGGFSVDDEVIVMCTVDGEPVRIVGFVDGIKSCGVPFLVFATTFHDPAGVEHILYTVWDVEEEEVPTITYNYEGDDNEEEIELPFMVALSDFRDSTFYKWMQKQEWEALEDGIEFEPGDSFRVPSSGCIPYPGELGSFYGLQSCYNYNVSYDYQAQYQVDRATQWHSPFLSRAMKNPDTGSWIGSANAMPRFHEEWTRIAYIEEECYQYISSDKTYTIYTPFGELWTGALPYLNEMDWGPSDGAVIYECLGSNTTAQLQGEEHSLLTTEIDAAGRPKSPGTFLNCLRSTKNKASGNDYGEFILHVYLTSFVIQDGYFGSDLSYTYVTEFHAGIDTFFDDVDASTKEPLSVDRNAALETALSVFFDKALAESENEAPTDPRGGAYDSTPYRPKEIKNLLINLYRGGKHAQITPP
jgi:hypothetical protein